MKEKNIIELFESWKKKECFENVGTRGQFVPDGIVDYDVFEKMEKRILFVLRDAHDMDNHYEERGICNEVLHSTNSGKTWYPIAAWARGLLDDSKSYASIEEMKLEEKFCEDEIDGIRKYFKQIAIMNLKKVSGGSISQDIEYFTESHKEEILKEIKIIQPDIIIACGHDVYTLLVDVIFNLDLKEAMEQKITLNKRMKNYGHYINISEAIDKKSSTYVVHYRHPAQYGISGSLEEHYSNMQKIGMFIEGLNFMEK